MKKLIFLLILLASTVSFAAYTTLVHYDGPNKFVIESGGEIEVKSGGTIDIESGGNFELAGTAVTSTAAELNLLDGSVAGTSVASKALVLGASKETDVLTVTTFTSTNAALGTITSTKVTINAVEADSTLEASNSGNIFTNGGAGAAVEFTMPTAVAGLIFEFVTTDTDSLIIIPGSGDDIDHSGSTNVANYVAVGTVGETVRLIALDSTSWQVMSSTGTWGTY